MVYTQGSLEQCFKLNTKPDQVYLN